MPEADVDANAELWLHASCMHGETSFTEYFQPILSSAACTMPSADISMFGMV